MYLNVFKILPFYRTLFLLHMLGLYVVEWKANISCDKVSSCLYRASMTIKTQSREALSSASLDCAVQKRITGKYVAITTTTSITTDTIEPLL